MARTGVAACLAALAGGCVPSVSDDDEGGGARCSSEAAEQAWQRDAAEWFAQGSGLGLDGMARETGCATAVALVEQGQIDLESPAQSDVLASVQEADGLAEEDRARARRDLRDWIEFNARCFDRACGDALSGDEGEPPGGTEAEAEGEGREGEGEGREGEGREGEAEGEGEPGGPCSLDDLARRFAASGAGPALYQSCGMCHAVSGWVRNHDDPSHHLHFAQNAPAFLICTGWEGMEKFGRPTGCDDRATVRTLEDGIPLAELDIPPADERDEPFQLLNPVARDSRLLQKGTDEMDHAGEQTLCAPYQDECGPFGNRMLYDTIRAWVDDWAACQ